MTHRLIRRLLRRNRHRGCLWHCRSFPRNAARRPPDDWPGLQPDVSPAIAFRRSPTSPPANVARLRPVCTFDTGEQVSFQTGPVVVNGVMYLTSDRGTYAIDAATCAVKWKQPLTLPALIAAGESRRRLRQRTRLPRRRSRTCHRARRRHRRDRVGRRAESDPARRHRADGAGGVERPGVRRQRRRRQLRRHRSRLGARSEGRPHGLALRRRARERPGAQQLAQRALAFRSPAARSGRRSPSTRRPASSLCPPATRRPISNLTRARATTCIRTPSSPSTRRRAARRLHPARQGGHARLGRGRRAGPAHDARRAADRRVRQQGRTAARSHRSVADDNCAGRRRRPRARTSMRRSCPGAPSASARGRREDRSGTARRSTGRSTCSSSVRSTGARR